MLIKYLFNYLIYVWRILLIVWLPLVLGFRFILLLWLLGCPPYPPNIAFSRSMSRNKSASWSWFTNTEPSPFPPLWGGYIVLLLTMPLSVITFFARFIFWDYTWGIALSSPIRIICSSNNWKLSFVIWTDGFNTIVICWDSMFTILWLLWSICCLKAIKVLFKIIIKIHFLHSYLNLVIVLIHCDKHFLGHFGFDFYSKK